RRNDVALLAIRIPQQRDPCRPVRVVLDGDDASRHAHLVTLPINDAVHALVAAAMVAYGHSAGVVTPAGLLERLKERAFPLLAVLQLLESLDAHASAAG